MPLDLSFPSHEMGTVTPAQGVNELLLGRGPDAQQVPDEQLLLL